MKYTVEEVFTGRLPQGSRHVENVLTLQSAPEATDWPRLLIGTRIFGVVRAKLRMVDVDIDHLHLRASVEENRLNVLIELGVHRRILSIGFELEAHRWLTAYFEVPVEVPSGEKVALLFYSPESNLSSGPPGILREL